MPAYHFFVNWLADVYYGHPSRQLIVIGITGTTGKTTSVLLIAEVLRAAGYTVGYTSTAMFSDGQRDWLNDKKMTMVGRFLPKKCCGKWCTTAVIMLLLRPLLRDITISPSFY